MLLNIFSISKFVIPMDIFTEMLVIIGINKVYSSTATPTATTATVFFLLSSLFLIFVNAVGTKSIASFMVICPSSVSSPLFYIKCFQ